MVKATGNNEELAKRIYQIMDEGHMKQSAVARAAGISPAVFNHMLRGRRIKSKIRMLEQLFSEQHGPGTHPEALRRVKDQCSALKQVGIRPEDVTYSELTGGASHTCHTARLDS